MEVIIHGTKGGYKILYQTQNIPFSIARDVRRSDKNDGNPVGETAFSIAFAEKGYSFSKYIIVRDIERAAVGNIAFSVFIPNNKKIEGKDILTLLDELAGKYCQDYIIEGNLGNKQEDWTFVNALVNQFQTKCRSISPDDVEILQQGKGEAAYIYYSTNEELQKYFDSPYQEEYSTLKQVFFVKTELQDNLKNPLNALRHDSDKNLTGKVDFENKYYKLKEFDGTGKNGVIIEVWANGKKRKKNDVIYKKDNIRICYTKGNYFNPIDESGKLNDDRIRQYLEIDDINNKINVKKDEELTPVIKTISIVINKIINGKIIPISEIDRNNINYNISSKSQKTVPKYFINNEIKFEGEELKELWTIYVKEGNFISKPNSFTPENFNQILVIDLEEHKTITFNVTDDGEIVKDYNIQLKDEKGKIFNSGKEFNFIGEQIYNYYDITLTSNRYEEVKIFKYYPAKEKNEINVPLIKKQITNNEQKKAYYKVDVETNGGFKINDCPEIIDSQYINNISKKCIKPPKNKIFVRWDLDLDRKSKNKFDNYDGTLVAIYEKKQTSFFKNLTKKEIIIIRMLCLLVILLFFIAIANYFINHNDKSKPKNKQELKEQINQYTDGLELNKETLISFKNQLENVGLWSSILSFISSEDNDIIIQKINDAIEIRNAVDSGNLDDLKNKSYSKEQITNFKQVVDSIKNKYKNQICDSLKIRKSSNMNLQEVSNLINKIQDELIRKEDDENNSLNTDDKPIKTIQEIIKPEKQVTKTTDKPVEYKTINSSNLEIEFLKLVNKRDYNKGHYEDLLKYYSVIGSPFINYLNKIKIQKYFDKFKHKVDSIGERKVIKSLSEINID